MRARDVLIFALGAVAGVAASCKYFKTKYEKQAREDIESVKAYWAEKNGDKDTVKNNDEPVPNEDMPKSESPHKMERADLYDYASALKESGYKNYSRTNNDSKPEPTLERPYVITPEEFGEKEGYTKLSLMYYADQVVADDMDHIVMNVDEIIGFDSLSHFGEYEDDSVFVRNDVRKCDYEILLSQRKYSEVLKEKPYLK